MNVEFAIDLCLGLRKEHLERFRKVAQISNLGYNSHLFWGGMSKSRIEKVSDNRLSEFPKNLILPLEVTKMGRQLTLELPDDLYEPLSKEAAAVGKPLDEWILARLRPLAQQRELSESEREAGKGDLMASAGCVNSHEENVDLNERGDKGGLQMSNVEIVVDKLVKEYFDIEEGIKSIVWVNPKMNRLVGSSQGEEIWLIEVDTTAIPAGRVEPFYFKPNEEVPYPVRIANITPDEWKAVKEGTIGMPEGWKLDGTERVFTRDN